MASGLNSTERTIISSASYVVALVVSIVIGEAEVIALTPFVFVAFAFPFLFGTRTLRLQSSLLVGAGISVTGLALLLFYDSQTLISLISFPLFYMVAGGFIGWLNERRQAKRAMWKQP